MKSIRVIFAVCVPLISHFLLQDKIVNAPSRGTGRRPMLLWVQSWPGLTLRPPALALKWGVSLVRPAFALPLYLLLWIYLSKPHWPWLPAFLVGPVSSLHLGLTLFHRITEWLMLEEHWWSSGLIPLLKYGNTEALTWDHIQMAFEYL